MFVLQWFDRLRFSYKLAILLSPCFVAFMSLAVWNGYANKVVDEINQQVDDAHKIRGDVMIASLVALHYGAAVDNQIPDTIRIKREELKEILGRISEAKGWSEKLDNAPLAKGYIELVRQVDRILVLEARVGAGVVEEAALLGDMASTFNQALQTHIDSLSQHRLKLRSDLASWNIVVLVVGTLLSAAFGLWISRSLINQLGGEPNFAAKTAGRIAEGDLTVIIETKPNDQSSLLFAMKRMNDSLVGIVSDVRGSTDAIGTAALEIAAGSSDLSKRTEEQASSLEETASNMEALTATVKQNAENAKQANQLSMSASDIAVKGGQAVSEVVHSMASISASSKKIVDIISVIESIAFQTNILALNAAVEAARAGEQGRGFAVVAAEVRNLAQRSAAAAKEIKTLIGDSVDKVDIGSKQADQAGATMNEIVTAVKRVTTIMSEIAAASSEQSAGIEQVNQAIIQMDDATQQNAALVEQAAAAAEAMHEQADSLTEAVSVFKLAVNKDGTQTSGAKSMVVAERRMQKNTSNSGISHSASVAPPKGERKLDNVKKGIDEDWKEY
jgi:methyl-accepting chemotaxis protein